MLARILYNIIGRKQALPESELNAMAGEGDILMAAGLKPGGMGRIFRRSVRIRQVDAGSCNGCELEIHAINNPIYNCEKYGIHFTASPRFADLLLVTGPVTRNMEIALRRTYNSTPVPKLVVAAGDCACNGGIFGETYASLGGIDKVIPVDARIPGCPPTPLQLMQGLTRLLEGAGK